MPTAAPLGVICVTDLGWKTIRSRWQRALPLEFSDLRFFNPEEFERSKTAYGSRSLRQLFNTRAAAKAAIASGCRNILVATNTDSVLLPQVSGVRYNIYMDAAHAQARWVYGHKPPTLKMKTRIAKMRKIAKAGHKFLCMSRWAAQGAADEYRGDIDNIFVVPPPIDTDLFSPQPKASEKFKVVFLGGQFERKGGAILAQLAQEARFADWEWHFITSQEGPSRGNVHFHNGVKPESPELLPLLASGNLLALPSKADCSPLAILEAQSCGLAVVASNIGAISEMVHTGIDGVLLDFAEDAGEALARYLDNPRIAAEQGNAGRERVLRENALPVHARKVREAVEA